MARLKKGSAAAKAWGRRMKRLRSGSTKSKKRYSKPKRIKTKVRYMPKKKRSRSKKTASIFGINTGKALAAGLYGAVRARMSNFLAPYTAKIPAGVVSDEVGMVVALQLLKKFALKRAGVLRDSATIGQAIEFARIGEAVSTGQINLGGLAPAANAQQGNLF